MTRIAKRLLDVVFSSVFLVVMSPLFLIIAVLVVIDSRGPAFFINDAVGRDGAAFGMIKFRTMRHKADDSVHRERTKAFVEESDDGWETDSGTGKPIYKIIDDPRITRVGAFLRRTSLDEIPQFVNVLMGQMSLVGPRPILAYEYEMYDAHARQRLAVRPGITGVNQVYRRSMANFTEGLEADIQYAGTLSFWRDVKLIALTIPAMVRGKGSY